MAAHFSVRPAVAGTVSWERNQLVFTHAPFRASTAYTVRLGAGYRDLRGHPNQLSHSWRFLTEAPPSVTGSTPSARERNVDPAGYISLQFTREMDIGSLQSAVSISPLVPITVRRDPSDARRAIVAPISLLDPGSAYAVTVTRDARDVDGNPLAAGVSVDFNTGPQRPLRHWITFLAQGSDAAAGIWLVDEARIPRQVAGLAADGFAWSQDDTRLLARSTGGVWSDKEIGGASRTLPFRAEWAAYLGPGLGYAYLDRGRLSVASPNGSVTAVDHDVSSVAVSPEGGRLAYVTAAGGTPGKPGSQVFGYTVELRSRYRLASETEPVDSVAWAPDASRLAYRLLAPNPLQSSIRVKNLTGQGATTTVAIGEVDAPRWQADSRHLILSATVSDAGSPHSRPFRVSATEAAARALAADQAIPIPAGAEVRDPLPSPDGHQLAFLQPTPGGDQVWIMNLDGSGFGPLTAYEPVSFPYSCRAPAWTQA